MSIQTNEINKLKEQVASLETDCKLANIMQKEEEQKAARIKEKLKSMERDLTLKEPL